jgi:hypothetical protein
MSDYTHLAGHKFPGGTYTLPGYVNWLWTDAAQLTPDPKVAHPGLIYLVAIQGSGLSIQDVFDLMDATADSGVMFGEYKVEAHGTLKPDTTYDCEAEVVSVERKSGRRAGVFDKLSFEVRIREQGSDELIAVTTNDWIFPRKGEEA